MPDPSKPAPAPPWTTSEFWSKVGVDGIAGIAMLLTFFTGDDHGIEGAEAAVPAAAIIASAIAHAAYANSRTRLKVAHLEHLGRRAAHELERLEPLARDIAPLVEAADPALAARAKSAEAAHTRSETPA